MMVLFGNKFCYLDIRENNLASYLSNFLHRLGHAVFYSIVFFSTNPAEICPAPGVTLAQGLVLPRCTKAPLL